MLQVRECHQVSVRAMLPQPKASPRMPARAFSGRLRLAALHMAWLPVCCSPAVPKCMLSPSGGACGPAPSEWHCS